MRPPLLLLPVLLVMDLAPARAQGPRQVRLSPAERTLSHEFTQIRGLRELADGRLLVSDRLEPALFVVDLGAGTIQRIGREGEGPGEYRMPGALLVYPGDSTLLLDDGNARLSVIGPDLRVARAISTQRPGLVYNLYPRAVDQRGRLYFQVPGWAAGPEGSPGDSLPVARLDLRTGVLDTLARIKGPTDPPGQIQRGLPYVPFAPEDVWQAGTDGRLVFVRSADYHVESQAPDGRITRGKPVAFEPLPVTEADRLAYTRNFLENSSISGRAGKNATPSGLGPVPSEMLEAKRVAEIAANNTFATRKPGFADVTPRLGPDGALWVERSRKAGAVRVYDVFDPAGTLMMRVTLPENRRLLSVGRGGVYLVATTEAGLEHLERYRHP